MKDRYKFFVNPFHEDERIAIQKFYEFVPFLTAFFPAVLLSGIGLERFSLYKAEDFVEKLTKSIAKKPTFQGKQQKHYYSQFMAGVQQKQLSRLA